MVRFEEAVPGFWLLVTGLLYIITYRSLGAVLPGHVSTVSLTVISDMVECDGQFGKENVATC